MSVCVGVCVYVLLSLELGAGSLLLMASRKASQHVLLMAASAAVPDGSWEAARGVQTPLWVVDDPIAAWLHQHIPRGQQCMHVCGACTCMCAYVYV